MENLISVIVPVYNTASYLRGCIESIIAQTHDKLELILVNDGSEDGSGDICDEYAKSDKRVFVIHQSNKGVSNARNAALKTARGQYMAFIDSDDLIEKDMLESLVNLFEHDEQCDLAVSGYFRNGIEEKNEFPGGVSVFNQVSTVREMANLNGFTGHLWNKLFKADIIRKYCIDFDENLTHCEDSLFCHEYARYLKKSCFVNQPKYYYEERDDSAVNKHFTVKRLSGLEAFNRIYDMSRRYGNKAREINRYLINIIILLTIQNIHRILKSDIENKFELIDRLMSNLVRYGIRYTVLKDRQIGVKHKVIYSLIIPIYWLVSFFRKDRKQGDY